MKLLNTILHPTDFSEQSNGALQTACTLAREHDSRLILFHVHEPQEVIEGEFGMLPPEPEPTDEELLAGLQRLVPADGSFPVECRVARGVVTEEILRAADETQCDLIVMATHSPRNFITRWFHANVADHVTKEAPCEVRIVESTPTHQEQSVYLD